jgi:hypothetical protein
MLSLPTWMPMETLDLTRQSTVTGGEDIVAEFV